jgi:AraC family transcriptional regulator
LEPVIKISTEKKFIGKHIRMSLSENRTLELWRSFMPHLREIKNNIGTELYSVEIYDLIFFSDFNPRREFEKWAAVAVSDFETLPAEMETLISPPGLYAVFLHRGGAGKGAETYQYIFGKWLPQSEFLLDNRPHFAIMGEKYKNDDPDSEEELWIPVKKH